MRDIPIVFPISLAIIVAMLIFTSAYAVSANAVAGQGVYSAAISPGAVAERTERAEDYQWFERAALLVCPLH